MKNIIKNLNSPFISILIIFSFLFQPIYVFAEELVELDESNSNISQDPPIDGSDIVDGTYQGASSSSSGGVSRETDDKAISLNKFASADQATGAFLYDYSFNLPKGRNNLTPELNLSYNSNDKSNDSIVGYGWSFDIPSIKRLNKKGTDKLYTSDDYTSSLSGELIKTDNDNNFFRAKVEGGDFINYTYKDDGSWVAIDKMGTKYTFGKDTGARKDDPSNGGHIYEWMLEEVRDTNDNFIRYEYYKNNGQIYPSKIFYTGHGTTDGIFEVKFTRESFDMSPKMYYSMFEVKNNFRIKSIEVLQNNQWIQKYTLNYTNADNGYRQLLSSVTENGRDLATAKVLSKNPTEFTYKKRGSVQWVEDPNWKLPYYIGLEGYTQSTNLAQLRDINGDSYPDLVLAQKTSSPDCDLKKVWINNANGTWTENKCPDEWYMGPFLFDKGVSFKDTGYRILDYNGDYRNDLLQSFSNQAETSADSWAIWDNLNNVSENWKYDKDKKIPIGFVFGSGIHADNGTQVVDINGDGLADIVRAWLDDDQDEIAPLVLEEKAFIGDGEKWVEETDSNKWNLPWGIVDENPEGSEVFTFAQFMDLNGDGLVDYIFSHAGATWRGSKAGINTGSTWALTNDWVSLNYTQLEENARTNKVDGGMRNFDANGDGLTDLVISRLDHRRDNLSSSVYTNTMNPNEKGFLSDPNVGKVPLPFAWEMGLSTHNIIADVNADGMDDIIKAELVAKKGFQAQTFIAQAHPFTDMLVKVKNPEGSISDISYKMSTKYFDNNGKLLNPKLQIAVTTVEKIETDDGSGNKSIEQYTYKDGHYYYNNPQDRKFAGFGIVEKRDAVGNLTKTYYHQGNETNSNLGEFEDHSSKIGKTYREEFYDNVGKLYKLTINKWDRHEIDSERNFVKNILTLSYTYDGGLDHRDIAEGYVYDNSNGNLKEKIEYGEVSASDFGSFVDIGNDKKSTNYSYAQDPNGVIIGMPDTIQTKDYLSNKVSESRLYYDNQSLGFVLKGNKTQDSNWVAGSIYSDTNYQYNSYGLIDYTYDHYNKNQTNYTYDSYNMYPVLVVNDLSQQTAYEYNYKAGSPSKVTYPNGSITEIEFDPFTRPSREFAPDPISGSLVEKKSYTYNDTSYPNSKIEKVNLSAGLSNTTYTYIDGFGRTIQTKTEAENGFITLDFVYDNLGNLIKESLPYITSSGDYSTPTTNTNLLKKYSHDAVGRIVSIGDVSGTISNNYNLWATTITDQLGNQKVYTNDAFGNLISVKEGIILGTFYITSYNWDSNANLIKITDAQGNIRNFGYNALGERIMAEDLHSPSDTSYGIWLYSYDLAGNLKNYQNPNGNSVSYTYDNINRVLSEDSNNTMGIDVVYTYDSCVNGKGYVCSVVINSATDNYEYTKDGRVKKEIRTIGASNFATEYILDYLGNVIELRNPDLSSVRYVYNSASKIDKIDYKKDLATPWSPLILNIDYSPTGQVAKKVNSNGITTIYDFDDTNLYRLKNIKSSSSTIPNLQNISYIYDKVGNVLEVVDTSANIASKKSVYTYDNLYRLISADITNTGNLSNYSQTFSYSPIGNITAKSDNTGAYQYNGSVSVGNYANPHAITNIGSKTYTYDKNGNLLSGTGMGNNTWDYRNRLRTSHLGPANIVSYDYDNSNQRVKYQHGVDTVLYPNKFYNIKNGINSTKHIFAGADVIATIERVGPTENIFYNHEDNLNSSSIITTSTGIIDQTIDYYPYGTIRINDKKSTFDEQRKFTSHEHDNQTGLDYMNARYYNGVIGKFISQDPVFRAIGNEAEIQEKTGFNMQALLSDPQQLNSYSYARSNPIMYSDPTGNLSWDALLNSPVNSIQHVMGWEVASLGVNVINRPFTADLLRHSASLNPGDVSVDSGNQKQYGNVIDSIKGTSQYQGFVNQAIENAKNGQNTTSGSLQFDKGDLYTSLHRVNIQVGVEQTKDGWTTNTTISDRYDFNPTNSQTYKGTVTRIPATQAYKDQQKGVLSNYNVNIKISDKIKK
jgi:RHS repeat-associated protein